MSYEADPRVDEYIDALPEWQQEICREVRELVHDADPELVETIKRRVQPYFVLEGNVAALLAAKDHVNVSCMTRACPTPTASSPTGTVTRRAARSASGRASRWMRRRSSGYSRRSSPTTAPAAGASSRAGPRRNRMSS